MNLRTSREVILLLVFVFGLSSSALGCMYGPPFASVCEKYARADAIIIGNILDVRPNGVGSQLVEIRLEKSYKANLKGTITLDQPLSSCDWDFSDQVGKKLLLYLSQAKGKKASYSAIGTGYGGPYDRETSDLYWLDGLPGSLKRNRIAGTIKLFRDEPFSFIKNIEGMSSTVSSGKRKYDVLSDPNGVFQIWDVPAGKYRIKPDMPEQFRLGLSLSMGHIDFRPISKVEVDIDDFEVVIGKEKCGGSNYVFYNND